MSEQGHTPAVPPLPDVFFTLVRNTPGAENLHAQAAPLERAPFTDAFLRHHDDDAHFMTYAVVSPEGVIEDTPRIKKVALPHIRIAGGDVVCPLIVVEWDTPGHVALTPEAFAAFLESLTQAAEKFPQALAWTLCYSTRNGARLVYVLDTPVPAEEGEAIHRGMVESFIRAGVAIDMRTKDWTHLFRLPYVVRDSKPTWEEDVAYIEFLQNRLVAAEAPRAAAATKGHAYADIIPLEDPCPTPEEARRLLWALDVTGKEVPSDWFIQARKRLRGRDCYPALFEMKPLAMAGERDSTIHEFVGQVVSLLYYVPETTPAAIYALFYESVEQLAADPKHPAGTTWLTILWSAVKRLWEKEDAKARQEALREEENREALASLASNVAEGMKTWCPAGELDSPKTAGPFAARHLIAQVGGTAYIMRPDGTYDPTPVTERQLIAAIRARGMDSLIDTTSQSAEGATTDRPIQHIINEYVTVVNEIIAMPGAGGGKILNVDTPQARLLLPAFWRNTDLKPEYNEDVDTWLRLLGGKEYERLCKWIAWSLAFDEGCICALSIKGKAGSGKKMLAHGLAECLRNPKLAGSEDLVGDYNYGLLETPFLVVDEGWVKSGRGRHPADQFRALVAGDSFQVKRKFFAPVNVINPVRVLFTANNIEAIRVLTHRRELSPQDREALAVRLLHFDISDDASNWLQSMGGIAFTGQAGRRWIRGDGGEPSDHVVAKHFLHLYETRAQRGPKGARFLVEGNGNEEILFELRTQSGSSPLVIEALLKMLEAPTQWPGLVAAGGRLWVSAADVLEYYRSNLLDRTAAAGLTADAILNVCRGLSHAEPPMTAFVLPQRAELGPRRWTEIDLRLLLQVAQKDGWPCKKLLAMVQGEAGKFGGRLGRVLDGAVNKG